MSSLNKVFYRRAKSYYNDRKRYMGITLYIDKTLTAERVPYELSLSMQARQLLITLHNSKNSFDAAYFTQLQESIIAGVLELLCIHTAVSKQLPDFSAVQLADTIHALPEIAASVIDGMEERTQLYTQALANKETDFHIAFA